MCVHLSSGKTSCSDENRLGSKDACEDKNMVPIMQYMSKMCVWVCLYISGGPTRIIRADIFYLMRPKTSIKC